MAGIVIAAISAVVNFTWLPYSPFWAILLIAVDLLIIWSPASARFQTKAKRPPRWRVLTQPVPVPVANWYRLGYRQVSCYVSLFRAWVDVATSSRPASEAGRVVDWLIAAVNKASA